MSNTNYEELRNVVYSIPLLRELLESPSIELVSKCGDVSINVINFSKTR
jgi:hypothetical protein